MKSNYIAFFLLMFFLQGCANGYVAHFKPNPSFPENLKTDTTNPNVEIFTSSRENIIADLHESWRRNYVSLGQSNFIAPSTIAHNMKNDIERAAQQLGADLAFFFREYESTSTSTTSITMPDYQTTYHRGTVSTLNGYGTYSGTSVTHGTKEVPITVTSHRYIHRGYFLKKNPDKPKIGFQHADCDADQRKALGKNSCVIVSLVLYDTPAFRQNLMEGDFITKWNNHDILDTRSFLRLLETDEYYNKDIFEFEVVRNSEKIKVLIDTKK